MAALLKRLDKFVLVLRKRAGEDSELFRVDTFSNWPQRTYAPIQSHCMRDDRRRRQRVPVTITVRTPSPCNSLMSAAESGRGGSLSAIRPASFIASGGPAATARTLKPFLSSSSDAAVAVEDGCVRPMTAAKAPFTTRWVPPLESALRTSSSPDRTARMR